jgi:hypothetical protein
MPAAFHFSARSAPKLPLWGGSLACWPEGGWIVIKEQYRRIVRTGQRVDGDGNERHEGREQEES